MKLKADGTNETDVLGVVIMYCCSDFHTFHGAALFYLENLNASSGECIVQ